MYQVTDADGNIIVNDTITTVSTGGSGGWWVNPSHPYTTTPYTTYQKEETDKEIFNSLMDRIQEEKLTEANLKVRVIEALLDHHKEKGADHERIKKDLEMLLEKIKI